ncbi:hypothetical protein MMC26_001998 [Xylographa opegraphella]|nr:hypothetical protein [Xylographa opegraphella]
MAAEFLATHGIDLQAEMSKVQFGTAIPHSPDHDSPSPTTDDSSTLPLPVPVPLTTLPSILLPSSPTTPYTLTLSASPSVITSIHPSTSPLPPLLALPSLCHPHIHLDKAHLNSHPTFADLQPPSSSFASALTTTARAKALFTPADLLTRGNWLLAESVAAGVSHVRAFVEADSTVGLTCVHAGVRLQRLWRARCTVQLCVFAQDPVFSGGAAGDGLENRALVEEAAGLDAVAAVGSTPYVEADAERARRNVRWAVRLALRSRKHLDFHLDYNLDAGREPLVWCVLQTLRQEDWVRRNPGRTVCLGHCTRLTLFGREDWTRLRDAVAGLPVYFIGLPTSDLFMMGRPTEEEEGQRRDRVRGTLPVPWMVRALGLHTALGVNNVGNAFTPWGGADPLGLAALGVGLYQAGTAADAELLYECVSTRAREAIGFAPTPAPAQQLLLREGDAADLVLYGTEGRGAPLRRRRTTVREVVCDAGPCRTLVKGGCRVVGLR